MTPKQRHFVHGLLLNWGAYTRQESRAFGVPSETPSAPPTSKHYRAEGQGYTEPPGPPPDEESAIQAYTALCTMALDGHERARLLIIRNYRDRANVPTESLRQAQEIFHGYL